MSASLPTDLEIAHAATPRPLVEVAADLGLSEDHLEPWGRDVAKIDLAVLDEPAERHRAKYVVVTAITPTPLGEGKTTTSVGLAQALGRLGKRAVVALRQPSRVWSRLGLRASRRMTAIAPAACRSSAVTLLPSTV